MIVILSGLAEALSEAKGKNQVAFSNSGVADAFATQPLCVE
jgi:hypothetical protein